MEKNKSIEIDGYKEKTYVCAFFFFGLLLLTLSVSLGFVYPTAYKKVKSLELSYSKQLETGSRESVLQLF